MVQECPPGSEFLLANNVFMICPLARSKDKYIFAWVAQALEARYH